MPKRRTPLYGVDVPALWTAVAVRLAEDELNETQLAEKLRLTKQTLSTIHRAARLGTNYQPSSPILFTLCSWLGDPTDKYRMQLEPEWL